jgi:nicotinamidase-related amidase
MWRQYYRRWPQMTREVIDPDLIRLLPELELFTPPAMVFDKSRYSPWIDGRLDSLLRGLDADTLIISGGETEVCVLSTIFGAVDLGYRVVVAADGLFSSVSDLHSAVQTLLHDRFSQQVESVLIEEIIDGRE